MDAASKMPIVEAGITDACPDHAIGQSKSTNATAANKDIAKHWLAFIKTRNFWIVLLLGQILSISITGASTLSSLLANANISIPAFQILPAYLSLCIFYTSYTIYEQGFTVWLKLVFRDGWRYFVLAFLDVQGNYFVVLAYRYTTILQAQLISIWAIVVIVIVSFLFLRVRYAAAQYAGIFLTVGGLALLIASDHITGSHSSVGSSYIKGDLFALLGVTFYGLSNTFEEFLVSKRPLYEVIGQLGFWAAIMSGLQAAIFDRQEWAQAKWDAGTIGYLAGFTFVLMFFYSLCPLMFRLSSAAFFNISLTTANFWGVLIGLNVFGYSIHWMYPIAFLLILGGLLVYFLNEGALEEAQKPWLAWDQADGVSGVGTARRTADRQAQRTRTYGTTTEVGVDHGLV